MANAALAELSTTWHLGTQRRRILVLTVLTVLVSLLFVVLVLALQVVSAVVLFTWIVMAAIAWRPLVGLSVAFGLIVLFEAGGADALMLPGAYLHGGLAATVGLPGIIESPLELLLLLTFGLWAARGVANRYFDYRGGHLGWPIFLFFLALLFGLGRGIAGGGDVNVALWESRFLFYAVMCYVLAANTIRRYAHLRLLMALGLVGMGLFAIEGAYRRVALIDTGLLGVVPEFAYSHEDVIFLGSLMLLVLAQNIFGAALWQRLLGLALLPVAAFTLLASERRAGYIAVIVAVIAYGLVFVFAHRRAFFTIILPLAVAFAIYLPIFWNNTGLIGQPARAVRSLSQPDPRDAQSNLYRDLEKFNVRATIRANPLLGVGFGRPFDFVIQLPDLSWWPFWHYEPHHNILWVWLKTGPVGFILFFTLMGAAIARGAYSVRWLPRREAKVFALFALSALFSTLVFCYVDLGLVSGRVTILLGTTIGGVSILDRLTD